MNTAALPTSPRFQARLAGIFELSEGFTSTLGQIIILGRLVVAGNIAATAANILAHKSLYWVGFASSLVGAAVHLIWALLFYELFRHVNRTISLLAVFFVIVCCAMQALAGLFYIAPLLVLDDAGSLASFSTEQLQSIVAIFLKLNEATFEIDLVFFGLWCVLTGWLIYKSGFMPRLIGILLTIDGLGWFLFIVPPVAHQLFPVIAAASALGEIPLMIYLLVVGLNVRRWNERAQLQRNE